MCTPSTIYSFVLLKSGILIEQSNFKIKIYHFDEICYCSAEVENLLKENPVNI